MAKKKHTKFVTKDILKSSVIGSFQKLDPRYMVKNPVMFVVEVGFLITLALTFVPTLFGGNEEQDVYKRQAMLYANNEEFPYEIQLREETVKTEIADITDITVTKKQKGLGL